MTADRLAQGLREPEQRQAQPDPGAADRDPEPAGLPASSILAMCDRLLDEVGRRRHMFAWLRVPGSNAGEWLAVDAYYPRARLVVMCRPAPGPHDSLYRKLVPAHGLGLLMLDPPALGDDPDAVRAALAAKLFDLEHTPRTRDAAKRTRSRSRAGAEPVSAEWTPVKVERTAVAPAVDQGVGMVLGLMLAVVLIAEVYLAVVYGLGAGRIVLAFAIALEACSRVLGTVAAAGEGERAWACGCAIGGAPVVAWFALTRRAKRAEVDPTALAGLLAGLAGLLGLIALLTGS